MVTDNQKKLVKRIIIKPSTMVLVQNKVRLEQLRQQLADVLKIHVQDITFSYVEVDKS